MSDVATHETRTDLIRAYSRRQAMEFAVQWMRDNWSEQLKSNPDKYHEKLGLLVDFVTDMFPAEPNNP
jgi:hypothetical protein